jgi:hypothetical protein
MAPGWFAFSLERDEKRWTDLTTQIDGINMEADLLIASALKICDDANDKDAKGRVLMSAAAIAFQRYLNVKLDALPSSIPVPSWLLTRLRERCLYEYILYDANTRHRMRRLVGENEARFLEAVQLFMEAGEEEMAGYAYYNLANNLRSAYQFGEASLHLNAARNIAEKYSNETLLQGTRVLKERIRAKNRGSANP